MLSAPSRRAFFNPRPVPRKPGADQLLVALGGARGRLRHAPAACAQPAREVTGVVSDRELALDESLDPGERPLLSREAGGLRTTAQLPEQFFTMLIALAAPGGLWRAYS